MFDGISGNEKTSEEDNFVSYNSLMLTEEQKFAEADAIANEHDSSFEFDVKPDDIYDLYLF
jgi:hypothetical protein